MPEHTNPPSSDSDAIFIGWQETLSGISFPLFDITIADHPLYRSTVSEATLYSRWERAFRTDCAERSRRIYPKHHFTGQAYHNRLWRDKPCNVRSSAEKSLLTGSKGKHEGSL